MGADTHVHRWTYYDDRPSSFDRDTALPTRLADLQPESYVANHPYNEPHRQCYGCPAIEWAVPAITVQQPWAWAQAVGARGIELRSRPTRWRGPLAIHAGTRWSERGATDPRIRERLDAGATYPTGTPASRDDFAASTDPECAFGAVVALVTLADCHPAAGCCPPWGDAEYAGKPVHHLTLTELRPVNQPVVMPGRLGVWVAYLPWPVTDTHECERGCGEGYADPLPDGYCVRISCRVEASIAAARSAEAVTG